MKCIAESAVFGVYVKASPSVCYQRLWEHHQGLQCFVMRN